MTSELGYTFQEEDNKQVLINQIKENLGQKDDEGPRRGYHDNY